MRSVGVISPFLSSIFLGSLFLEVVRQAPGCGCRVVGIRTGAWGEGYRWNLATGYPDAWIILLNTAAPSLIDSLVTSGRPVCCIASPSPSSLVSSVRSDNAGGVRMALDALWDLGHRAFAFVGHIAILDTGERYQAFLAFLSEKGIEASRVPCRTEVDFDTLGGWSGAQDLWESGERFTALVAGNDQNGVGALGYFRSIGVDVPGRVAIVGYDNSDVARDPENQLSTLDQRTDELVRAALADVLGRLDNRDLEPCHLRIAPLLVLRGTTHPGAVDLTVQPPPVRLVEQTLSSLNFDNEVNHFMSRNNRLENIGVLLSRLSREGRRCLLVPLEDGAPSNTDLGRDLFAAAGDGALMIVVPVVSDQRLGWGLVLTVPRSQVTHRAQLALVAHELELTAIAIERASHRERLEQLVSARTSELELAHRELVRAARISVLSPIVTGISHHLNTPLGNGISAVSAARQIVRSGGPTDDLMPILELLERNLSRAALLVDHFRRAASLQFRESRNWFAVRPLFEEVRSLFLAHHPSVALTYQGPGESARLMGNPAGLSEALMALLENAADHGCPPGASPQVRWLNRSLDGLLVVEVEDSGAGVPPGTEAKIFEPFFTTSLARSTGLGLTLVQNVVTTLFQGTVGAENLVGGGFRVTCRIPLEPPV